MLQGSDDGLTWTQISDAGTRISGCNYIQGNSGYFAFLRVNPIIFTFTNQATYSVTYSGTAAPGGPTNAGLVLSSRMPTMSSLQSNAQQNASTFVATKSVTNPGANSGVIVFTNYPTNPLTVFPDHVLVTCTAACTVDVVIASSVSGCTGLTPINSNMQAANTTTIAQDATTCGSLSFSSTIVPPVNIAANTPTLIDLSFLVIPFGARNNLFAVRNSGALTGTETITAFWYER